MPCTYNILFFICMLSFHFFKRNRVGSSEQSFRRQSGPELWPGGLQHTERAGSRTTSLRGLEEALRPQCTNHFWASGGSWYSYARKTIKCLRVRFFFLTIVSFSSCYRLQNSNAPIEGINNFIHRYIGNISCSNQLYCRNKLKCFKIKFYSVSSGTRTQRCSHNIQELTWEKTKIWIKKTYCIAFDNRNASHTLNPNCLN